MDWTEKQLRLVDGVMEAQTYYELLNVQPNASRYIIIYEFHHFFFNHFDFQGMILLEHTDPWYSNAIQTKTRLQEQRKHVKVIQFYIAF